MPWIHTPSQWFHSAEGTPLIQTREEQWTSLFFVFPWKWNRSFVLVCESFFISCDKSSKKMTSISFYSQWRKLGLKSLMWVQVASVSSRSSWADWNLTELSLCAFSRGFASWPHVDKNVLYLSYLFQQLEGSQEPFFPAPLICPENGNTISSCILLSNILRKS